MAHPTFDFWLVMVGGGTQLAMTVAGMWMALRPPNAKYHLMVVLAYALVGLLGLGALIWAGVRTANDQDKVKNGISTIVSGIQSIQKTVTNPPKPPPPQIASPKTPPSKPRLKPLVTYTLTDLLLKPTPEGTFLQGFNLVIMNESDETLTGKMTRERILADGTVVVGRGCDGDLGIIELRSGATSSCLPKAGEYQLSPGVKQIVVEFGIEYDTIPPTGVRHSYRELTYDLNWANGPNKLPVMTPRYSKSREY